MMYNDGAQKVIFSCSKELDGVQISETREGWAPKLTVENETNEDSKSTNELGSSFVGLLGFSCR
jgi:hypothetical protein